MPLRPLVYSQCSVSGRLQQRRAKTSRPATHAAAEKIDQEPLGPLPAYQREVSGTLTGVPAGAEVELALLVIDERSRPQQLLASSVPDWQQQTIGLPPALQPASVSRRRPR